MYHIIFVKKSFFLASQNLQKIENIVIPKSDKGNYVVIVDEADYLDKMKNPLDDTCKYEKKSKE